MAKKAFKDLSNVLKNRNIMFDRRKRILNSYVWSIPLSSCEAWRITKNMEEKVKSLELWLFQAYAKSIMVR